MKEDAARLLQRILEMISMEREATFRSHDQAILDQDQAMINTDCVLQKLCWQAQSSDNKRTRSILNLVQLYRYTVGNIDNFCLINIFLPSFSSETNNNLGASMVKAIELGNTSKGHKHRCEDVYMCHSVQ